VSCIGLADVVPPHIGDDTGSANWYDVWCLSYIINILVIGCIISSSRRHAPLKVETRVKGVVVRKYENMHRRCNIRKYWSYPSHCGAVVQPATNLQLKWENGIELYDTPDTVNLPSTHAR